MTAPDTRSPATLAGVNRAEGNRIDALPTIATPQAEADFTAAYLARRYRLSLPVARVVAALARLGRAFV